uniref:DUF4939 domain-containing protein n=1 Tax=Haplochromis burtoni TaxID=8153 RepID=A0A3Q3CAP5_HAPBU
MDGYLFPILFIAFFFLAPVSAEPHGRPDGLLATLDMLFECQPTKYATARAKVAMLTSLLSGQAQEWAAALYNNKSAACNDYALFVEELKKTFCFMPWDEDVLEIYDKENLHCQGSGVTLKNQ